MDVVDLNILVRPSRFVPHRLKGAVLCDASADIVSGGPNIDYEHSVAVGAQKCASGLTGACAVARVIVAS